jgi:hypothetical protein
MSFDTSIKNVLTDVTNEMWPSVHGPAGDAKLTLRLNFGYLPI